MRSIRSQHILIFTLLVFLIFMVSNFLEKPENCSQSCVTQLLQDAETVWQVSKDKRIAALQQWSEVFHAEPWKLNSEYSNIWDLFTPGFHCPLPMERVGHVGDGGKWVCGFTHVANKRRKCLVYSYGINQEITFEQEILERSGCRVRMFDHTIDVIEGAGPGLVALFPHRAQLFKVGVGAEKSENPPLRTIAMEMQLQGDEFIDILKVDVEGAELPALMKVLEDFPNDLPFAQLLVELHPDEWPGNPFDQLVNLFDKLEERGLRAVISEFTQIPFLMRHDNHMAFVDYVFINTRINPNYFHL